MESASLIAIGSSMIESGLRASFARTRKVNNAVSETPVNTVPSAFAVGMELTRANLPRWGKQRGAKLGGATAHWWGRFIPGIGRMR
jgi:hypothetical protein